MANRIRDLPLISHLARFLRGLLSAFQRWKWQRSRAHSVEAYFAVHPVRKLQIGSGWTCLPGWLNVDITRISPESVYMDATRPFPFEDATFDYAFSEHAIEHMTYEQGVFMLRECHRVLKPGGKIRIATPNLQNIVGLLTPNRNEQQQRYIRQTVDKNISKIGIHKPGFVINHFFWGWGHYFVYDPETLRLALESVGFSQVRQVDPGESGDVHLKNIESHGKVIGEEMNRFETMVMEATRP